MSASSPYYMLAVCVGGAAAGVGIWWASTKLVNKSDPPPPSTTSSGSTPAEKKKLKEVLLERGVQAAKISLGCIVYELLGAGFLLGSWALCWTVQPTKILQDALPDSPMFGKLQELFSQAAEKAERISTNIVKKIGYSPDDPARLSKALAESLFLRMLLKPILLPLKLWITYFLLK